MSSRTVYINPKQAQFMQARQLRRTFIGGRGSGKSSVIGFFNWQCMNHLPRAKRFLAALTYDQILTKTWPSMEEAFTALGLREYNPKTKRGHYVICKRPPIHWPKPYSNPRSYEHVISFINGYAIELLSMDSPNGRRGGSYDGGDMDESALLKQEMYDRVLEPSIRGNRFRFDHYLHGAVCDFSSAAWLPSGQWIYDTEELAKSDPDNNFYMEATAYDNAAAYGADKLARIKADLYKKGRGMEWDMEYMNKRLSKLPNGFYPAFLDTKHCQAFTFNYHFNDNGLWTSSDNFLNPVAPLETSWDFNAAFTSLIVCQEHGNEFRVGDELFVEDGETNLNKIDALTDKFIATYKDHQRRVVFLHGDRNGNNKNPQSDKTFYQQIQERLERAGWEVHPMVTGLDPDHQLKHKYLNAILAEDNTRLPIIRFNQNKCKWTIISIQNAPITPDWKKDKKSERPGKGNDQKRATHLSDCFDNIVYRKYSHLFGIADVPYQVYFL